MKPRRTTYQNKHRIQPKNRYAKPIRKPKDIPEVEEQDYDDPNDGQPTLDKFLEGIGMKEKPKVTADEVAALHVSLDKLKENLRVLRQSMADSQGIVLSMSLMCIEALRSPDPDERERVADSLQDWVDNIRGTNQTMN